MFVTRQAIRIIAIPLGVLLGACDPGTPDEIDMAPPTASISFPHLDETWVEGRDVVVSGVASDDVQVASVTVNGVEATSSDGFATWQARLELAIGQASEIAVTVIDRAGNVVEPADTITVNTHVFYFGRACGSFSYDLANNRMFSSFPLAETSLTDGTTIVVSGPAGSWVNGALPLYDDLAERLYAIDEDGALVEVDLTDHKTVTTISPEGSDGISIGWVSEAALDRANGIVYAFSDTLAAVVSISLTDGARSIVASSAVGAGPGLESPTYLAFGGSRLFAATGSFEPAVLEIDLASGNRTVISDNEVGSDSDFLLIQGLVTDSASSVIYVADFSGDLFQVDPATGARTIVSPATQGLPNGAVFEQHLGMQFVDGNGSVLVSDCQHGQLLSIDPSDGARSILTPPFRGDGPPLIDVMAMALRQAGDTLITLNRKGGTRGSSGVSNVISVDTTTGGRAILSNEAVGSGEVMADVFDVVDDSAHGRYLVTDSEAIAVITIDPDTGDRAILSDNISHGAGVQFLSPLGIAIDMARNRAVVVDVGLRALIGVDLETGDRTIISQVGGAGGGDDFNAPVDIELDVANDRAFVTDQSLNAVFSVDLSSGARAILSGDAVGSGDPLQGPTRIAFDTHNDRIAVTNLSLVGLQNLLAYIDPDTGDRDFRPMTGMSSQPEAIAFDPRSGLLYLSSQTPDIVLAYDYESSAAVIFSQ
jgi:sugar lactone lactonase YvrE